jgi:ribonuclease HII
MRGRKKWTVGIDEVGRGALAGPVVVAAALVYADFRHRKSVRLAMSNTPLRDSKKLSPKQRERWFAYFKEDSAIAFSVARAYPRRIEKMNISRAANLAAEKAYKKLIFMPAGKPKLFANLRKLANKEIANIPVSLDGGLFLGNGAQPKNAKTIAKGDEKIPAIAVASIIAKIHRDHYMCRLAKKYPAYGFEVHKGYGTKLHYGAIRKHGLSDAHRKTFCR